MVKLWCCFRGRPGVDDEAHKNSHCHQWSGAYREASTVTTAGASQVLLDHGCVYGTQDGTGGQPAEYPGGAWQGGSDDDYVGGRCPSGSWRVRLDGRQPLGRRAEAVLRPAGCKDDEDPGRGCAGRGGSCTLQAGLVSRSASASASARPTSSFASFTRGRSNRVLPADTVDGVDPVRSCGGNGGMHLQQQGLPQEQGRPASLAGGTTLFRATGSFLRQRQPGDPLAVALVVVRGSMERTTPVLRGQASLTHGQRLPHHPAVGARRWQSFSAAGEAVQRQREQNRRHLIRTAGAGGCSDRSRTEGNDGGIVLHPSGSETLSGGEEDSRGPREALPLPRQVLSSRVPSFSRGHQPPGAAVRAAVGADLQDMAYGSVGGSDKYGSEAGGASPDDGDADRVRAWHCEDDADADADDAEAAVSGACDCKRGGNARRPRGLPPDDDGSANDADCSEEGFQGRGPEGGVVVLGGLAWVHGRGKLHSPVAPQSPNTSTSGAIEGAGGRLGGGCQRSGRSGVAGRGGGRDGGGDEEQEEEVAYSGEGSDGGEGEAMHVAASSASLRWRQSRAMRPQRSILKKEDAVAVCRRSPNNLDMPAATTTGTTAAGSPTIKGTDPASSPSPLQLSPPVAVSAKAAPQLGVIAAAEGPAEPSRPGTPEPSKRPQRDPDRHQGMSGAGADPPVRKSPGTCAPLPPASVLGVFVGASAGAVTLAAPEPAMKALEDKTAGATAPTQGPWPRAGAAEPEEGQEAGEGARGARRGGWRGAARRGSTDDGFTSGSNAGSCPSAPKASKVVSFHIVAGSQQTACMS